MVTFAEILTFIKKQCGGESFPGCHIDVITAAE
jgi:hypothetical protein